MLCVGIPLINNGNQYANDVVSDDPADSDTYSNASWDYVYTGISELVLASDLIGMIEVGEIKKEYELNGIPFTQYNLTVVKSIFNCEEGQSIVLTMTGIKNEDTELEIPEDPLPSKGDKFLVFAKQNVDGTYCILGGPQGRLMYTNGILNSMNNVFSKVPDMNINIKDAHEESIINEINSALKNK
ncbi:hypothetical protein [Anaerobium acetethylicum]|uniref:hypothetical protein n=1 Tax=Anaerobium acetethylicum TaxID=1619234 RepID=UPI000B88AAC0|nr:hypothetical protein [Anaerobium acetethylicum]